jgi:hypothetical protein
MHEPQTTFVPLTSISLVKSVPVVELDTGGCGCGNKGPCHSSEGALEA